MFLLTTFSYAIISAPVAIQIKIYRSHVSGRAPIMKSPQKIHYSKRQKALFKLERV